MPKFVERFLKSLSVEQAEELWDWLDADPAAADDIIEFVSKEVLKCQS